MTEQSAPIASTTRSTTYVRIEHIKNFSANWSYCNFGYQKELFQSQISNGKEKCTLNLVWYPGGYDEGNQNYIAIGAFLNQDIDYKIIVTVAIRNSQYEECFKKRMVFTKANYHLQVIKDFISKYFLKKSSSFFPSIFQNDTLKIACRVTVLWDEKKFTPDASLLQIAHLNRYENLFENGEFSDFKLIVSDTTFKVHKCILATHSSVFAAMFCHDMSEKNQGSTVLVDVDVEVVKEFLRFIYTGKIEKLDELATQLWIIADKYEVDGLKEMSEGKLIEKLNVDTIAETLCLLEKYNMTKVKDAAIKYVINNAAEITSDTKFEETFRKLSPNLLTDLLYASLHNSKIFP